MTRPACAAVDPRRPQSARSVVPIVDLSSRFYGYRSTITRLCIVVVEIEQREERIPIGLLIDALHEVVDPAGEHRADPGWREDPPTLSRGSRRTAASSSCSTDRVLDIEELQAEDTGHDLARAAERTSTRGTRAVWREVGI